VREFGVAQYPFKHQRQGIVYVIGPERSSIGASYAAIPTLLSIPTLRWMSRRLESTPFTAKVLVEPNSIV
jgi:hypothetical protein